MNICIDISQIIYSGTGVARFTYQLVKTILASSSPHRWTFFFSSLKHGLHEDIRQEIREAGHQLVRWYIPPRLLAHYWNGRLPKGLTSVPGKYDFFISSDWTQPPAYIANKRGTIVHDLVFKIHPETVDELILKTQNARLTRVSTECDVVWFDSKSTMQDFDQYYPSYAGLKVVNYPGVMALPFPKDTAHFPYTFRPQEYFFTVGKREPRKNLKKLSEAFLTLVKKEPFQKLHLVIAGPTGWETGDEIPSHPHIHILGEVSDNDLSLLYSQALAFIYPTLYEGFGIPPLEAMGLGCPVVISNTSSLPEIASKDSALFINPHSTDDMVQAMFKIASDHDLRDKLVKAGKINLARFSWTRYLSNMLESMERIQSRT